MFSASKSGQYQGYQISRSVRLRAAASANFSKAAVSTSTNTLWTYSIWVKRGSLSAAMELLSAASGLTNFSTLYFRSDDCLQYIERTGATTYTSLITTQVFRDPSAWYHIVLAYDSTNATAANRVKLYVNGTQITSFSTATYPATSQSSYIAWSGSTLGEFIGRFAGSATEYLDGYITEVNFVTGQSLTPSSFGQYNAYGVWTPVKYNGTYGTNGFYLNFSDNSGATATTIGKDSSGNGNNWTPNNISVTAGSTYDSMLDVPTPWGDGGNNRGNYTTLNPLKGFGGLNSSGNLNITNGSSAFVTTIAAPQSGKWYFEFSTPGNTTSTACGVFARPMDSVLSAIGDVNTASTTYYRNDGALIENGSTVATYTAWSTGANVIGVALDMDAKTIRYYLNNTAQGASARNLLSTTSDYTVAIFNYISGQTLSCNFGQRPFSYTPPSGFLALNTQNLPTPTIANGANYFAATTYTGTGASRSVDNTVNNVSFQPDFVWAKGRSGATDHALYDAVRGVQKQWETNTTTAETTETTGLTAFNSNGFTVGALAQMNTNTATYVAWQWKEGATQGFDIVTYTGNSTASRSVNHNLGVTPSMIFVKNRTTAQNNPVAHTSLAVGNLLLFDTTGASTAAGTRLRLGNSTAFTVGDAADYTITNQTGNDYVAYCFAAIAGFSAFGSYTGNGSADGPFVFCGFRPAFVLIKNTNTAGNEWFIYDDVRNTFNVMDKYLLPNSSAAEGTFTSLDFVSNGFKLRTGAAAALNANAGNYIYAAFAENPFKYSLAR